MLKVEGLYIYPVKSCRGIRLSASILDRQGLQHDRKWMVVDREGVFVTQRKFPRMAAIRVSLAGDNLSLSFPDGETVVFPSIAQATPNIKVRVWRDWCLAVAPSKRANQILSKWLDYDVRIVRMAADFNRFVDSAYTNAPAVTSFSDGFPLVVVSRPSLQDLNTRLESPLEISRFRPNLVVEGCLPFGEDTWAQIQIGHVSVDIVKPCTRCIVTTINPNTGTNGPEPLRALAKYREFGGQILFGQNAIHRRTGTIRVGTPIKVISTRSPVIESRSD